jgi:hypothetical protein
MMDIRMYVNSPAGQVAELRSKPRLGVRLGGLWELDDGWSVGGIYDNYLEAVKLEGLMVPVPFDGSYRSEFGHYGVAKRMGPWLLVADRLRGRLFGAPSTLKVDSWLYGADYKISPTWTVRAGSFEGQPTAGLSYQREQLKANLSYVRNLYDDELHALLGSSTSEALTVSYTW